MIPAVLSISSFLICLLLTPLCRNLFLRLGLVDHPDAGRKLHANPTPRSGGIAIVLSCALAVGIGYLFLPAGTVVYIQHRVLLTAVLPATLLIFAIGVMDDLFDLRPRYKLLGQAVAAAFAVAMGAHLAVPFAPLWLSMVLSVIWLLACTNAINLIDGMDGLAAGVSLTAAVATLGVALISHNAGLALAAAPMVGALLAFLRYNFAPASVFLGDAGSLTIGFLLGCFGMVWSGHTGGLGMLGPMMALALPLIDVSLAIARRFLRSVPIFKADRGHIHHRVLALGLSTRRAAVLLYGCCIVFASLALLQSFSPRGFHIAILLVFVVVTALGVRRLEYVEFRAARRILLKGTLRGAVQDEIFLQEIREALSLAQTPESCWLVVSRICEDPRVLSAELQIFGRTFHRQNLSHADEPQYSVHVPLGEDSWLTLTGSMVTVPRIMTTRLHQLQIALRAKMQTLERPPHIIKKAA